MSRGPDDRTKPVCDTPLAGVEVVVRDSSGAKVVETSSRRSGDFAASAAVPSGRYAIEATALDGTTSAGPGLPQLRPQRWT